MRYKVKAELSFNRQPLNKEPPRQLTSVQAEDEFEFAISQNRQLAFISTKWDHDIVSVTGLK
jgi:hypothetical protein